MITPIRLNIARVYQGPNGRDPRMRRTIDFFARKGFMSYSPLPQTYRQILTLEDVLWTCEHVTPELLEVLPAARLRFPKHIPGPMPDDLTNVVDALGSGRRNGPNFRGHPFEVVRAWLTFKTKDGRMAHEFTARVQYKISPELTRLVKTHAKATRRSASDVVSEALRAYLARG